MQGNCSEGLALPPAVGTLVSPLRPGQCVLVSQSDLFTVNVTQIWIDGLFLRVAHPTLSPSDDRRQWKFASLIGLTPGKSASSGGPRMQGEHYITNVTFEGDGRGPSTALWADSDAYVQGTHLYLLPLHALLACMLHLHASGCTRAAAMMVRWVSEAPCMQTVRSRCSAVAGTQAVRSAVRRCWCGRR